MKHGMWAADEIGFIREHWQRLDDAALGVALSRSMSSVATKRLDLGLKRPRPSLSARHYTVEAAFTPRRAPRC